MIDVYAKVICMS